MAKGGVLRAPMRMLQCGCEPGESLANPLQVRRKEQSCVISGCAGPGTWRTAETAAPEPRPGTRRAKEAGTPPASKGERQKLPESKVRPPLTRRARKAAWKQAVQQHKDLYDQEVQSIVQKRLGKYKGMEEQMEKLSPMLRLMQQRYGVQNVEDLARAVMNDNAYYEDEASRHGMDVETFKQLEMTRMENQRLREQQEASERDRQTAQKMLGWRQAEAELKKVFPDFSLDAEIENSNGEMFRLLESGVPMDHAYKVLHMDELMQGTLAGAVQRTQQRTLETIAARGMRPAENGVGMSAERAGKFDISKLSRAKMEELERRSARGERITPEKMFE